MSDSVLDRFRLDGRVAVVTGSARGLGLAIARALSQAGAAVVVTSRDRASADAIAGALPSARAFEVDVKRPESIESMVAGTIDAFGRLDILVNNAGTTRRGSLEELTLEGWDDVLDTNLKGAWLSCRAVIPIMRSAGWGRLINVSSMLDRVGLTNRSPYIASKGGMSALTRALAVELSGDGINVNAICPGPFQTDMADSTARENMLTSIPLGRWGDPAELGPAAVFLASDASSFMTGTTLTIDGGYTAR